MSAATSPSELGLERARGALSLTAAAGPDGRSRAIRQFQSGCLRVRLPAGPRLEAVTVMTAGGLTGGDHLDLEVVVEAGAALTVTSAAAEKVYRARDAGPAEIRIRLDLAARARLDWLPQETILFDRARLDRRVRIDIEDSAELLVLDGMIFGRTAMAEAVAAGSLADRWSVFCAGQHLLEDRFTLADRPAARLALAPVADGACALGLILAAGPGLGDRLEALRAALEGQEGLESGAGLVDGLLVARLLARDGQALRRALGSGAAALGRASLPRVWHC